MQMKIRVGQGVVYVADLVDGQPITKLATVTHVHVIRTDQDPDPKKAVWEPTGQLNLKIDGGGEITNVPHADEPAVNTWRFAS
jgi:hypothetical protein